MKELSIKDKKIIKGKLEGKTSKEIAQEVYPNNKAGDVNVRQALQKTTVKQALYKELKRQGLTLETVVAPVAKGIKAQTKREVGKRVIEYDDKNRPIEYEYLYEYEDNIPLQLSASDRAVKLLGLDKIHDNNSDNPDDPIDNKALLETLEAGDTVTLQQIVFKKGS